MSHDVTIVIPAYNASDLLKKTLPAAIAAAKGGRVVVVDPGSTDDTSSVARSFGVEVLRLPQREGPAEARNRGVERIDSEVVLFIDADCVAHPDVVDRVWEAFRADASLVSVMGSYDDDPPAKNFFSQYMNLRHHYTHQRANTEDAGFWAGCGAVRRKAFVEAGGFDADRYPRPMIEDIELGVRLKRLGKMKLDPKLHVTHLKRWTMRSVIETDIKCRAIPWSKLILETGALPNDLNLKWSARVAAALAPFALAGAFASPVAAALGAWPVAGLAAAPALVSMWVHRDMIFEFAKIRGIGFALPAWLFHQVHLTYSAATMAILAGLHFAGGPKRGLSRG